MVRSLRSQPPSEEPKEPPKKEKEDSKDALERLKADEKEKKTGSGGGRKKSEAGRSVSKKKDEEIEKEDEDEKKAAYGCQLAPRLPPGQKVRDARGENWVLGKAIGSGGFGDIYLCDRGEAEECAEDARWDDGLVEHA